MKILVTGANGQLGQELMHVTSLHEIVGLTRAQLDITNFDSVKEAINSFKPNIIINAAAYTQVDKAEQERELAFAINRDGAANLARCCAEKKIPLIHISTDYVFAGDKTTPYCEDDITQPINWYGETKLAGEQAIQQIMDDYIILRVSSVFGFYGNNFVKTILRLAREKESLRVIADKVSCPTAAHDIAIVLLKIVDFIATNSIDACKGIYHFCNAEPVSWHMFAKVIVEQAGQLQALAVKNVQAIPSSEYPTQAKRPVYSVLDTQKIQQTFSININSWRLGLFEVLQRLCV